MHTETRQILNLGSQDISKKTLSAAPKSDENVPNHFWAIEVFVNNGKGWEVRKKG